MTEIITTIESSKSTQLDTTSTSAIKQMVATYVSQKRWKDATVAIKKLLRILLESYFSTSIEDVGQPVGNPELARELAEQLIVCYQSRHRIAKAQDLRERLYRSLKSTRKIDDSLVKHNFSELLRLCEQSRAREKIIQLHCEHLEDCKKTYGPIHTETITALWKLAQLTSPGPMSIEYYRQIVDLLSKGSDVCHPDAINALSTIADYYWTERRYQDAVWAYSLLFNTFVQKGKEMKQLQEVTFVSTIFNRYVESLKALSRDTTIIYEITGRYRQTCTAVFGADHKLTQEATLSLAHLCRLSKRHESEAITLYEQLSNDTKASAYHAECRAILNTIYEEKALTAAQNTTSVSGVLVDRAVTTIRKRMTESRSQYGWTHEESLEQLKEMTYLYSKQSKKQEAVKDLIEATSHIITSESSSVSLVRGATAVASSFVAINEQARGLEIAREMRWQLVTKDASNSKKYNLDLTSMGRSAAIYLAQLEHELRGNSASFSETYLSILTEIVRYEEFQRSLRSNLSIETVFAAASRLHSSINKQNGSAMLTHIENEVVSFFLRISGDKAKVGDVGQVKILVVTMLEYFRTHQLKNYLHSVNLASVVRVRYFLSHGENKLACDLAQTTFRYCQANGWYETADAIKHGLILAIAISDVGHLGNTRQAQIQIGSSIIRQMLESAKKLRLNFAAIPLKQTNTIVRILGEQQDYITLEVSSVLNRI